MHIVYSLATTHKAIPPFDGKGLKFTKIDNAIRSLYAKKDLFMSIDKGLFATPLARVLAKTTSMKEAHLLGLQAAKMRWESNTAPDKALENVINPTHRYAIEAKRFKKNQQKQTTERGQTQTSRSKTTPTTATPPHQQRPDLISAKYIIEHQPSHAHPSSSPNLFVWTSSSRPCLTTRSSLKANDVR
jgi:hypothetical protein